MAEAFGELPAYSDISPPRSVTSKHELIPAIVQNLGSNGMSYVILIPSDELSLAAVERPSWDTGTGATDEEEVLSFAAIPKEQKKVLRLPTGGGFTWDHISQSSFRSNVLQDLQQALYHGKSPGSVHQGLRLMSIQWGRREPITAPQSQKCWCGRRRNSCSRISARWGCMRQGVDGRLLCKFGNNIRLMPKTSKRGMFFMVYMYLRQE